MGLPGLEPGSARISRAAYPFRRKPRRTPFYLLITYSYFRDSSQQQEIEISLDTPFPFIVIPIVPKQYFSLMIDTRGQRNPESTYAVIIILFSKSVTFEMVTGEECSSRYVMMQGTDDATV
jgi:hypothetical protein